jgi:hypothetical protein
LALRPDLLQLGRRDLAHHGTVVLLLEPRVERELFRVALAVVAEEALRLVLVGAVLVDLVAVLALAGAGIDLGAVRPRLVGRPGVRRSRPCRRQRQRGQERGFHEAGAGRGRGGGEAGAEAGAGAERGRGERRVVTARLKHEIRRCPPFDWRMIALLARGRKGGTFLPLSKQEPPCLT